MYFYNVHWWFAALQKSQREYEEKLKAGNTAEKSLFKLAWKVKELDDLLKEGRKLVLEVHVLVQRLEDRSYDVIAGNAARQLDTICKDLTSFIKTLSRHKRAEATHIFVMMISPEDRSCKPYSLPVQCLPIRGLKDLQARSLGNKIVKEMVARNMKVAGW